MYWVYGDLVSALAFGSAYTGAYYPVTRHHISSIAVNSAVKCMGAVIVLLISLVYGLTNSNSQLRKEIAQVTSSPVALVVLFVCSAMWFAAEALFYEASKLSPQPSNATAIWNLSPVPVFLLTAYFYKVKMRTEQYIGLAIIMLAIYLINM